jgi:hypothetical protein
MKLQGTYSGWDFIGETTNGTNDYWNINGTENSGYPFLYHPTIFSTLNVTNKTDLQADGHIDISFLGIVSSTDCGICWNTTPSPTTGDELISLGAPSDTGTFSATMTGLVPATTYYYRSYITNQYETRYGNQISFTTEVYGEWPEGEGTEINPYQIANLGNLEWLSEHPQFWNLHYIQTASINAAETKTWDSGAGFSPIGNSGTNFSGWYDGQNFIIDSLYVIRPSASYVGFFGYTNGATIDSLGITNDSIVGSSYVGGFVGRTYSNSQIVYCYTTGIVRANAGYSGGFAGYIGSSG